MGNIDVYHTTSLGNGERIVRDGWIVDRSGTNIYGRGIYFWEYTSDAHRYGSERFGKGKYEIIEETIPVHDRNSVVFSHSRARGSHIDSIAQGLLARGVDVVVISNPHITDTTMSAASGRAFLWLVDIRSGTRVVRR